MKKIFFLLLFAAFFTACNCDEKVKDATFTNRGLKVNSEIMTPEVLWSFGRVGNVSVSPDGKTILFTVSYSKIDEDRTYTDIYTMPAAGGSFTMLTHTKANEFQPEWHPDGKTITFLAAYDGDVQLYEMSADGKDLKKVTGIKGGIDGYKSLSSFTLLVYKIYF
jgi:Tol biopolymer transport system component